MELVSRNVLRHVYGVLQARKRLADTDNISNLQLFYNRIMSEYSAQKKGQCLVVPLTGQDVDDFYSHRMSREDFVEIIRTKLITKITNFDPLFKLCWGWFCGPSKDDPQRTQSLMRIDQKSAFLLWLIFCKLDTDGELRLHCEDVAELILHLLRYMKVTADRKIVMEWLFNQTGSSTVWISFWSFFTVAVDKCLAAKAAQLISRAVKGLYDEVVNEILKCAAMCKKGSLMQLWRMRWFVLTITNLICYESKETLLRKGSLAINFNASVNKVTQDKSEKDCRYPNRFKAVDGVNGQFFEISAESPAQMNEWIDAINLAIKLNIIEGRNYIHRLQIAQRNTKARPQKSLEYDYESVASTILHTETPDSKQDKHFETPEKTEEYIALQIEQVYSKTSPRPSHGYVNIGNLKPRQTSSGGKPHQYVNFDQSDVYGRIPLENDVYVTREQNLFNEDKTEEQNYMQIPQLAQGETIDGSHDVRVNSSSPFSHPYDTITDCLTDVTNTTINGKTECPEEEHQSNPTHHAEISGSATIQSPELFAKVWLQEKQLQKMLARLHSLEQSIAKSQAELITEQQRSDALEEKCKTLHLSVIKEQHNSQSLELNCQSLETRFGFLHTKLISEQQKTESLEAKCKYLESSIQAERHKSQSLEAKCFSQEERLKTMEDTVERLWALSCDKNLWTISRDEINSSNKILGTGGWGYVTEATFRGRPVAAKYLHEDILSSHNQELFAKEMKISARCRHKNLVEFIGAVPDHPAIIVIELMNFTLRFALSKEKIMPNHVHSICSDVARGLSYLHNIQPHPLIHRDVSAPNVLLKSDGTGWIAKLSDLGSAQFVNIAQTCAPGCALYAAPEIKDRDTALKQTEKVDVYSYGVLLIEILSREMPMGILSQLINSLIPVWPQFIFVIQRCTNYDPTRRLTMKEVIDCLDKITV